MGIYSTVLQNAAAEVDLFAPGAASVDVRPSAGRRPYIELATRLLGRFPSPTILAFGAVKRGEGVTRTVRGLAAELAQLGKSVACLDSAFRDLQVPRRGLLQADKGDQPFILGGPLGPKSQAGIEDLAALRDLYAFVLLDCGALESSVDILSIAPAADGVLLVVEAGRTGKAQLNRATQVIAEAQGTLLGFVLNKRRYPIPNWLYRVLFRER